MTNYSKKLKKPKPQPLKVEEFFEVPEDPEFFEVPENQEFFEVPEDSEAEKSAFERKRAVAGQKSRVTGAGISQVRTNSQTLLVSKRVSRSKRKKQALKEKNRMERAGKSYSSSSRTHKPVVQPELVKQPEPIVQPGSASQREPVATESLGITADSPAALVLQKRPAKVTNMLAIFFGILVRLILVGITLAIIIQVLETTPPRDIFIQWTTTPLTIGESALLVGAVALREVTGQFKGTLALHLRSWLNFLIPLLLLIFVSLLLNKFDLVSL